MEEIVGKDPFARQAAYTCHEERESELEREKDRGNVLGTQVCSVETTVGCSSTKLYNKRRLGTQTTTNQPGVQIAIALLSLIIIHALEAQLPGCVRAYHKRSTVLLYELCEFFVVLAITEHRRDTRISPAS